MATISRSIISEVFFFIFLPWPPLVDLFFQIDFFLPWPPAVDQLFQVFLFKFSAKATSSRFNISDVFIFYFLPWPPAIDLLFQMFYFIFCHGHQQLIYYFRCLYFLPWPPTVDLLFRSFYFISAMATNSKFIISEICIFCHDHQQ